MQATTDNNPLILDSIDNEALQMKTTRGKSVFIVEDNEMHSMMMDYLISKEHQFRIFRFKSGEECLRKLKMNPDIIILDYGLPGINGMETFNAIKKYNASIPVVVVTENQNVHLAQQFLNAGVYEYILKENNAFHKLNAVITSILKYISEREYQARNKWTFALVFGFVFVIIVASVLSALLIKHP